MLAGLLARLFRVTPHHHPPFFFCAGRTSRTRGEWFPVILWIRRRPGFRFLFPTLKEWRPVRSYYREISYWGRSLQGCGPAGKLRLVPRGCACTLIGWIFLESGIFPVPAYVVRYLRTKGLPKGDVSCPGKWPLIARDSWALGMWLDPMEMRSQWKRHTWF